MTKAKNGGETREVGGGLMTYVQEVEWIYFNHKKEAIRGLSDKCGTMT